MKTILTRKGCELWEEEIRQAWRIDRGDSAFSSTKIQIDARDFLDLIQGVHSEPEYAEEYLFDFENVRDF